MSEAERAGPGRPRSEETRRSILSAAFELGARDEPEGFSMAGIAARAGVSKQTIYRWWPTKGDVLLEALAEHAAMQIPTADRGSYRDDLRAFVQATLDTLRAPGIVNASTSLMAESQQDPEFKVRFRDGFLHRRRAALAQVLERADARGDRPSTLDHQLTADILFGVLWYRMLTSSGPLDDDVGATLVTLLSGPS